MDATTQTLAALVSPLMRLRLWRMSPAPRKPIPCTMLSPCGRVYCRLRLPGIGDVKCARWLTGRRKPTDLAEARGMRPYGTINLITSEGQNDCCVPRGRGQGGGVELLVTPIDRLP